MEEQNNSLHCGKLETIASMLEEVSAEYGKLWNKGNYHMRPGDAKRVAAYLLRIRVSQSHMRDTLKLFEVLLPHIAKAQSNNKNHLLMGFMKKISSEKPLIETIK